MIRRLSKAHQAAREEMNARLTVELLTATPVSDPNAPVDLGALRDAIEDSISKDERRKQRRGRFLQTGEV